MTYNFRTAVFVTTLLGTWEDQSEVCTEEES